MESATARNLQEARGERMKKTLIIGAGQLGRCFFDVLGKNHSVLLPCRADTGQVTQALDSDKFHTVVNCAAWTDVEGAEDLQNQLMCDLLNIAWPARLVQECKARGKTLVTFSTDYVFDGEKRTPYTVDDPVRPLNYYGRSKAAGEAILRRLDPAGEFVKIIRTAGLFSPYGNNFLHKILRTHLAGRVPVVTDELTTNVTDAHSLAHWVENRLIFSDVAPLPALVHYANSRPCTWFEVAAWLGQEFGFDVLKGPNQSKIPRPVYSAISYGPPDFPTAFRITAIKVFSNLKASQDQGPA